MIREFLISLFLHIFLIGSFFIKKEKEKIYLREAIFYIEIKEIETEGKLIEKPVEESGIFEKIKEIPKRTKKKEERIKKEGVPQLSLKGGGKAKISVNIPYSYYFGVLLQKISENWNYTHINKDTLKATIYFVILKDGMLQDIRIEKTSGDLIFDQSALRAVILTKRVPPLPEEMNMEFLKVYLEFEVP
ncbi:MAG: energy transducer TonB [candidate division WOR-3 bacterium]